MISTYMAAAGMSLVPGATFILLRLPAFSSDPTVSEAFKLGLGAVVVILITVPMMKFILTKLDSHLTRQSKSSRTNTKLLTLLVAAVGQFKKDIDEQKNERQRMLQLLEDIKERLQNDDVDV